MSAGTEKSHFGLAPVKREGGVVFYDKSSPCVFPERISLLDAMSKVSKDILNLWHWSDNIKSFRRSYWKEVKKLTNPEYICPWCDSALEIPDCTGDRGYWFKCTKCDYQFGGELALDGFMTGMYVFPEDLLSHFSELKKKSNLVNGQAW